MSPDEARFLKYFVHHGALPFVTAKAVVADFGGHTVIASPIVPNEALADLTFPKNIDAYLSNLEGLGLLAVRDDKWLADEPAYTSLQDAHREHLSTLIANHPKLSDRKLEFENGVVTCTSFGRKFIAACHAK